MATPAGGYSRGVEVNVRTVLMREMLGEALRELRVDAALTLRQVSGSARVSLGYLSEVERGQKEASSELLNSICSALEVHMSDLVAMEERTARDPVSRLGEQPVFQTAAGVLPHPQTGR